MIDFVMRLGVVGNAPVGSLEVDTARHRGVALSGPGCSQRWLRSQLAARVAGPRTHRIG